MEAKDAEATEIRDVEVIEVAVEGLQKLPIIMVL